MARQPRIEYEGACYHVMCRGDRREAIVKDDQDRKRFQETLGEACDKTGWKVHAWVLMDNHYHWLIETPEPNLVAGMKWFQNTYTRRFNSRHKEWGHVFGGRYKSILVEDDSQSPSSNGYFTELADYIHLNPWRAGLVRPQDGLGLLDYRWSSLSQCYGVPDSQRTDWVCVENLLSAFGGIDCASDRRKYIEHIERRAHGEVEEQRKMPLPSGQTLNSTLQRGWYWGSQQFRDELIKLAEKKQSERGGTNRNDQNVLTHGIEQAETFLKIGMEVLEIQPEDLKETKGSAPGKVAIALAIKSKTTASLQWIADSLSMGSSSNVSQQIRRLKAGKIMLGQKEKAWLDSVNIVT